MTGWFFEHYPSESPGVEMLHPRIPKGLPEI